MRFYAPSQMTSVKDTSGFTKMKYRQTGQGTVKELLEKDTRKELEERERKHFSKMSREEFIGTSLLSTACALSRRLQCFLMFCIAAERNNDLKLLELPDEIQEERPFLPLDQDADEEDVSESDGESSDEDEEAELLAELERIKQERAEETAKAAAAKAAEEEKRLRNEVSTGNPLLQDTLANHSDFRIKRRWDDDVVFRNQASKEPAQKRRFINDTIRNDFHRRFLDRYMV